MLNRRTFSLSVALGAACLSAPSRAQTADATPFVPNHPAYAATLQLLVQARWSDLISSIAALPPQSAYALLTDIGDGSPLADDLNALARARGGAGIAGAILAGWAWRYRGHSEAIANERGFARHLLSSATLLTRVVSQDHDDGLSASFLFRVLKGAGETDALHNLLPVYVASRRKPVEGLAAYADAVSAKWLGSETEALEFARRYADSAPAASYGLIADAHVTAAVARSMSDDVQVATSAQVYLAQPAVASEIVAAHEHFSSARPDTDQFAALLAHAQFSFAFMQMGDAERTRLHLSAQGSYAGGPWRYLENPAAMLSRARAALGLGQT
jgi:hypothetical protein